MAETCLYTDAHPDEVAQHLRHQTGTFAGAGNATVGAITTSYCSNRRRHARWLRACSSWRWSQSSSAGGVAPSGSGIRRDMAMLSICQ